MNNTEKLAEALKDAQIELKHKGYDELGLSQYSYKIAELLEKKRVAILPFDIGDKLYRASGWLDEVDTLSVSMITKKKDGSWKIRLTSDHYKSVSDYTLDQITNESYLIFSDYDQAVTAHRKDRERIIGKR